jgi:hypothetical protein
MTIARWLAALGLSFVLALAQVPASAARSAKSTLALIKSHPMKFFVARGKPGACGPGCSEWIAAENAIDSQAHVRFRQFLLSLPSTRLPVFIHSPGGSGNAARAIGDLMREYHMTASVGKTVSVSKGARHKLIYRGARCYSNCVDILIGAVNREVAPGARVGVHAWQTLGTWNPTRLQTDLVNDTLRYYTIGKGIDAALVDLALKTPSTTIHSLSRSELKRFGITAKDSFETPWRSTRTVAWHRVVKSLTRSEGAGRQTTVIEINCQYPDSANIEVQRDLTGRERGSRTDLRLKSKSGTVWDSGESPHELSSVRPLFGGRDLVKKPVALDALLKAADIPDLVLEERFTKPNEKTWSREASLSTEGLYKALIAMLTACGNPVEKLRRSAGASH